MKCRGETDIAPLLEYAAKYFDVAVEFVDWWSWPEMFGSTAGPGGGIGGQMMTQFQVFAFAADYTEKKPLIYCAGRWRVWRNHPEQRWPR